MAKEIYFPRENTNGKSAILEFYSMMETLEKVHRCPVRMIRTQKVFSFYNVLYEVIETPKIKKKTIVDMLDEFGKIVEIPKKEQQ